MAAALCLCAIAGCQKADDGRTPEQEKQTSRLDEIAKKTGGDWAKLTPEDRSFLVELSHGSEPSAKMLLMTVSRTKPDAPARPGK